MDHNDSRRSNYAQAMLQFFKGYMYMVVAYILTQIYLIDPSIRSPHYSGVICGLLAIQVAAIIVIYAIPFKYLKPLSVVYHHLNTFAICLTVIVLKISAIPLLLWLTVIILTDYLLHPWKVALCWYLYIALWIVLACVVFYLMINRNFLQLDNIINPPIKAGYKYIYALNVFLFFLLIYFYFLYYLGKIQKICSQAFPDAPLEKEQKAAPIVPRNTQNEENDEKYRELFVRIEAYFDSVKPYVKSDFTIYQLALALNTNITYVYKAININRGVNFNAFINYYRIKKVKEMLQDNSTKYTFARIAFSCGFNNQSTFNKAFKEIEGITPSAYCKKLNKEITNE
jgi:AraC-like DNA-binding protein